MEPESVIKVGKPLLALNTQGCCFFCLKVINQKTGNEEGSPSFFQNLCHHLQIDPQKEIIGGVVVVSKDNNFSSQDTLELCQSCGAVTSKVGALFTKLEQIQMEINSYLTTINEEMSETYRNPERAQDYSNRLTVNAVSFAQFAFIDKLRKEISQKISSGARNRQPQFNQIASSSGEVGPTTSQEKGRFPLPIIIKQEEDSDSADHQDYDNNEETSSSAPIDSIHLSPPEPEAFPSSSLVSPSPSSPSTSTTTNKPKRRKLTERQKAKRKKKRDKRNSVCLFDKNTKKYTCFKCPDKQYTSQQGCWFHYESFHLKKKYVCGVCERIYFTIQSLQYHQQICNKTPEELKALRKERNQARAKHECETCGRKCASKAKLKTHISAVHLNERNFACEQCDNVFKTALTLKTHIRNKHIRERFRCNDCGKDFIWSHEKKHKESCLRRRMAKERKRKQEEEEDTSSDESDYDEEEEEEEEEQEVAQTPNSDTDIKQAPEIKIEEDQDPLSYSEDEDSS